MKISGFTFVKNAIKFDYPIVEAITSILPICDEMIVNCGDSEDDTNELIKSIDSDKIRIVESVWDNSMREGGRVLAQQTNIALSHCTGDWCFYIQGDEVIHENDLPEIKKAMTDNLSDSQVEGFLFKYRHFYGDYNHIGASRRWYRNEIRVIRNGIFVSSYKDAQGFRVSDRKLNVKHLNASVNHYGWVKPPEIQQEKQKSFGSLYHDDQTLEKIVGTATEFDYSRINQLDRFEGTHPAVMADRLRRLNWSFDYDEKLASKYTPLRHKAANLIERMTGCRIGEYKNYNVI